MEKTFFFIVFLIICCLQVQAQTLHAILFADTKDEKVGEFDLEDYYHMALEFESIKGYANLTLKNYYFKDDKCNRKNLENVLNDLQCSPNDVVFFYYSGHGGRSTQDKSDYPQMCLGEKYESNFYPLETVADIIKEKNPRLSIIMADCCNSISSGISPKVNISSGSSRLSKGSTDVYKDLFNRKKGRVIISSSKKGETSGVYPNPKGGAFTVSFLSCLQYLVDGTIAGGWPELLDLTQMLTKEIKGHSPIYEIDVEDTMETISPQPITVVAEATDLVSALINIANERNSYSERIDLIEPMLQKYFASPKAKIQVVGRNNTTIVATETAEDFLNRLSTAYHLVNVAKIDSQENIDGKIVLLRVHEMYIE